MAAEAFHRTGASRGDPQAKRTFTRSVGGRYEQLVPDRREIRRWFLTVFTLGACAPQQPPPPARPEIIPGEVLVHTRDASLLTTEKLSAALVPRRPFREISGRHGDGLYRHRRCSLIRFSAVLESLGGSLARGRG
jgi:hypothetical protein